MVLEGRCPEFWQRTLVSGEAVDMQDQEVRVRYRNKWPLRFRSPLQVPGAVEWSVLAAISGIPRVHTAHS